MPLPWDARMRLVRLAGVTDELLVSARAAPTPNAGAALSQRLVSLLEEVQQVVGENDPFLADEFARVVCSSDEVPPDVQAAVLSGWLKASLATESLEEQRAQQQAQQEPDRRRKQTIGFKIRSPITREASPDEESRTTGGGAEDS